MSISKKYLVAFKFVTKTRKNRSKIVNSELNSYMSNWILDMGNLYTEGFHSSISRPPTIKGVPAPQETQIGLAYKGAFSEPKNSNFNISTAQPVSNSIPEQEEVSVYEPVLQLIEQELNDLNTHNSLEKMAVLVLSRLKEKIEKLT